MNSVKNVQNITSRIITNAEKIIISGLAESYQIIYLGLNHIGPYSTDFSIKDSF